MNRTELHPQLGDKILVIANVFSDGSGDYAFLAKMLAMLIRKGFDPKNISLAISISSCEDMLLDTFVSHRTKLEDKIYWNSKTFAHAHNILNKLNQHLITICQMYKELFGFEQCSACQQKKHTPANLTVTSEKIDQVIQFFSQHSDVSEEFFNEYVNNSCFQVGIRNILTFLLENPKLKGVRVYAQHRETLSSINKETLQYYGINQGDRYLVITFLLVPSSSLKTGEGIWTVNSLLLSEGGNFSQQTPTRPEVFSPGFQLEGSEIVQKQGLGINQVDTSLFSMQETLPQEIVKMLGYQVPFSVAGNPEYHVAYLPFSTQKMTFRQIQSYFMFLFSIQTLVRYKNSSSLLFYLNENMFSFVKQFNHILRSLETISTIYAQEYPLNVQSFWFKNFSPAKPFPAKSLMSAIKNILDTTIIQDNLVRFTVDQTSVSLSYYKRLSSEDFQCLLYHSQRECVLTGDQSLFEAMSMGKLVLYDLLPHKIDMYMQIISMLHTITGKTFSQNDFIIKSSLPKETEYTAFMHMFMKNDYIVWKEDSAVYILTEQYGSDGASQLVLRIGLEFQLQTVRFGNRNFSIEKIRWEAAKCPICVQVNTGPIIYVVCPDHQPRLDMNKHLTQSYDPSFLHKQYILQDQVLSDSELREKYQHILSISNFEENLYRVIMSRFENPTVPF